MISKEFLSQYLWLIVIGVIILLALIGFIADKSGFLKKPESSDDKDKEPKDKDENVNFNIGLNDAVIDTVKHDEGVVEQENDDIFSDFDNVVENNVQENKTEEINDVPAELYAPLEDKKEDENKVEDETPTEKVVDFSDDEVWKF